MVNGPGGTATAADSTRTAVDKALQLLAAFPPGDTTVGVSELARRLDLTKSTVYRLLDALGRNGFVERRDNRYRLGRRLHDIGTQIYEHSPGGLYEALAPHMAFLYEQSRETIHLGTLFTHEIALLGRIPGQRPSPQYLPVGSRFPAHTSALGRAMLAYVPAAAEEVSEREPIQATTVGNERLPHAVAAVREDGGIAVRMDESRPDLVCVAIALLDSIGRPLAALSISGHPSRFNIPQSKALLRRISAEAAAAARRACAHLALSSTY